MPPKKRKNGDGVEKTNRRRKKVKKSKDESDEEDDFSSLSDGSQEQPIAAESDLAAGDNKGVVVPLTDSETKVVLKEDPECGELLISGGTDWDLIGRKPKTVTKSAAGRNLYGPHRLVTLKDVPIRTISSGSLACHSVVITKDGKLYSWGRNDYGQLGHGDKNRRDAPAIISCFSNLNIVKVACGRSHTLFLADTGSVFGVGFNSSGQLGVGKITALPSVIAYPTKVQHKGPPIQLVACGGEFSAIVDMKGNVYTFGSPEYGQLGHNSDGKYFVSSSKISFDYKTRPQRVLLFVDRSKEGQIVPVQDVEIVAIACGQNHMVALDKRGRVYTWGFGGYGRLGHAETKDEMMPRLVKFFDGPNRGAISIAAGSTYSIAVSKTGILYLWGQTKSTGEAAMYPKPIHDLSGWNIRSIGCCYKSIVLAADNSLVSWGSSPTYGELCLGEDAPKSTSKPMESKPLEDIYIEKVACGWGHTLLLARNSSDEDKARLDALPLFTP